MAMRQAWTGRAVTLAAPLPLLRAPERNKTRWPLPLQSRLGI